jgi:5-methylcytosine-specific restriction endonuclease McrA
MPVNIVSAKRAVSYLVRNKASLVTEDTTLIRSEKENWHTPSIIKLSDFIAHSSFSKIKIRFNKKTLLERDKFSCQYCGIALTKAVATIDHVVPKGGIYKGKTSWTNCVIACKPCNSKKGNNTPSEAGMVLKKIPTYPHYLTHLSLAIERNSNGMESWKQYFIY